jgi:hypothetical protein
MARYAATANCDGQKTKHSDKTYTLRRDKEREDNNHPREKGEGTQKLCHIPHVWAACITASTRIEMFT